MKTSDPTIERIRQTRHEISQACDHDPQKLLEHYIKYQQQYADRLITKPMLVKNTVISRQVAENVRS